MAKPVDYPKINYLIKFKYPDSNKWIEVWMWHKGHLRPDSLGGSQKKSNLVTQTGWTNTCAFRELEGDNEWNV